MKQYNDGGISLGDAFQIALRESMETGRDVEFEFTLVRVVVNERSSYEEVKKAWALGVSKTSYLTKQL